MVIVEIYLILFIMLLRLNYLFSRFVKPAFNNITHPHELLYHRPSLTRIVQLANLRKTNPKEFNLGGEILKKAQYPIQQIHNIKHEGVTVQAYQATGRSHPVSIKPFLSQDLVYDFEPAQIGIGFDEPDLTRHFSFGKGILHLPEYVLNENQVLLFNLPAKTTDRDVKELLKNYRVKNVKLEYCALGFVSLAKVAFYSQEIASKIAVQNKDGIVMGNKTVFVKAPTDLEENVLRNRYLVIQGIDKNLSPNQLLLQLSKYGRVIHFELPLNIRRKATKQQIKQKFQNSNHIIRIIQHTADGKQNIEYFPKGPELHPTNDQVHTKEALEMTQNIFQTKAQIYKRRLTYALDTVAYEKPQGQISFTNKGYCLVAYSFLEQAQNCYFHMQERYDVQLATKYEFQYDVGHKQSILRYINNKLSAVQLEDKIKQLQKEDSKLEDQQQDQEDSSSSLYEFIKNRDLQYADQNVDVFNNSQTKTEVIELPEIRRAKMINKTQDQILARMKENPAINQQYGRSFSQLADIQLFGTIVPKKPVQDSSDKIKVEQNQINGVYTMPLIETPNSFEYYTLMTTIERNKDRLEKKMLAKEKLIEAEKIKNRRKQNQNSTQQNVEEPKAQFSTQKASNVYRMATQRQKAQQIIAYNKMLKTIIDEYHGIFQSSKIQDTTKTFQLPRLNRTKQILASGRAYLIESDLPRILETHIDFEDANESFMIYHRTEQAFRSLPIQTRQVYINQFRNNQKQIKLSLYDHGVVEDVFEAPEGQDPKQFVNKVNLYDAEHGQHYVLQAHQDKQYIIKTRKLQPRISIEYTAKLQQYQKQIKLDPSQQATVLEELEKMKKTGNFSQEILQYMKSQNLNVETIIDEIIAQTGIPRKYFVNLSNIKPGEEKQLLEDYYEQIQMQKTRIKHSQVTGEDLVKDSSAVKLKDQDLNYKVSKFKQL